MPKYTYLNVSNTFFPAFLAFGSILKHLTLQKISHCCKDPGPA